MQRHRTRPAAAIVIVSIVLAAAACGGSDDDTGAPAGNTGAPADAGSDDDVNAGDVNAGSGDDVSVGDGDGDGDAPDTTGADTPDTDAPSTPAVTAPPAPAVPGGGTCSVEVTGDHSVSWTGGGTAADVLVSEWLDDAQREFWGDEFGIIVNCTGDSGDYLGFTTSSAADETTVPQAPGTYALTPPGSDTANLWSPLLTIQASETNWGVSDDGGTLELTTFDDSRIAGTFDIAMEDSLASFDDGVGEGEIRVTGTFDFPRP